MAVVLGVRAAKIVSAELRVKVSKFVLWTDSKCVLYWIHSPKVKSVFVQNRIVEIKASNYECRYVPTTENPADIPSRGCSLSDLKSSSLWWRGPDFLLSPETSWPQNEFATSDNAEVEELEPVVPALLRVPVSDVGIGFIVDIERFSCLTKLLRVTSWILRFRDKITGRHLVFSDCLSSDELNAALLVWIRFVQASSFKDSDFKSAQFRHLNMFIDDLGILRCRGRLEHSSLPTSAKKPILLPKKSAFTFLLIASIHKAMFHASARQTLASVRNDYWIPHGRSVVRSVLNRCQLCRRVEGGPFKLPASPALPSQRVVRDHPFSTTGVDYFGPLFIKHVNPAAPDETTMKVWICLFTCAVTRAIHLEVVLDNSSDQFFLCLQRFSAIYGSPSLLISDNAKQFVSASEILKTVFTADSVQDFCSSVNIKWQFIPALSPWMGGFYESLVGVTKRCLRKVLGPKCLDLVQLQTVVAEVSSIVNSRPLIECDLDATEIALSPAHFLGKGGRSSLPAVPDDPDPDPFSLQTARLTLIETWSKGQRILNEFWNSWHKEYLATLRDRQLKNLNSHSSSNIPISKGTVVLLREPLLPRIRWKMGRVVELQTSLDGNVRSVSVRLANKRIVVRPLKLLYPIESSVVDEDPLNLPLVEDRAVRTTRKAALTARKVIGEQLDSSDSEDDI